MFSGVSLRITLLGFSSTVLLAKQHESKEGKRCCSVTSCLSSPSWTDRLQITQNLLLLYSISYQSGFTIMVSNTMAYKWFTRYKILVETDPKAKKINPLLQLKHCSGPLRRTQQFSCSLDWSWSYQYQSLEDLHIHKAPVFQASWEGLHDAAISLQGNRKGLSKGYQNRHVGQVKNHPSTSVIYFSPQNLILHLKITHAWMSYVAKAALKVIMDQIRKET